MKACQSFAIRISAFHKVLKSGHMATVGKIIPVNNEEGKCKKNEFFSFNDISNICKNYKKRRYWNHKKIFQCDYVATECETFFFFW